MRKRYWALPLCYLALVALLLLYAFLFDDISIAVFFGGGAAIALSLPFLLAICLALYFVRFVDVALLSLIFAVAITLVTAPRRAEFSKATGQRVDGLEQHAVQIFSAFLALLVVLSLIRLGLSVFRAGKGS